MKKGIFVVVVILSSLSYADLKTTIAKAGLTTLGKITTLSLNKDKGEVTIENDSKIKNDTKIKNSTNLGNVGIRVRGGKKVQIKKSTLDNKVEVIDSLTVNNVGIDIGK
jgi:NDP-sugar pyrophosphorylase family protein